MATDVQGMAAPDDRMAIVILTHGDFGQALLKSAAMVFGPDALCKTRAVCLQAEEDPDAYMLRAKTALEGGSDGTLVFVDMFGGTPFNTLVRLSREHTPYAISGVSMPLLLEALNLRNMMSGRELLDAVYAAAPESAVNLTDMINEKFARN